MKRIEFRDYTHSAYAPLATNAGKFTNEKFFIRMLEHLETSQSKRKKIIKLKDKICKTLGINKTVWGVKKRDSRFSWEFYFYNYNKENPEISITNLKKCLSPEFSLPVYPREEWDYFMFSFETDEVGFRRNKINGCDIYTTDKTRRMSGFSFHLYKDQVNFKNIYKFYSSDERGMLKNIMRKNFTAMQVSKILFPFNIKGTICLAKKNVLDKTPRTYGIYFNRVDIDSFLYFLQQFQYPSKLIKFVKKNKYKLNHFLYDIGFDFKVKNDNISYIKSGFYGLF